MELTPSDIQAMDARDAGHNGSAAVAAILSGFEGWAEQSAILAAQSAFLAYPSLRGAE